MSVYIIGLIVSTVLVALLWFAFVAPSERRYHERKLKHLQERIEKREQFLQQERSRDLGNGVILAGDGQLDRPSDDE